MIRRVATALIICIVAAIGVAAPVQAAQAEPLELAVTPHRVSFGAIPLGTTAVQEFTLTNTGTESLGLESIEWSWLGGSGGFTAVDFDFGTCGDLAIVLAPGERCTLSLAQTAHESLSGRTYGTVCFLVRSLQAGPVEAECVRWSGVIKKK